MASRNSTFLMIVVIVLSLGVYSQNGGGGRRSAILPQGFPPRIPNGKPVTLYKGLGTWRHPIATTSAEAQHFFNQGLTLLYAFNRDEAWRSFGKASELDPSAAMPYWGMAMSRGPYLNMDGDPTFYLRGACSAVESGLKLSHVLDRERLYLEAARTWCPEFRPRAYADAMRLLGARYPDDPDAKVIYAESLLIPTRWHWYAKDGTPSKGVQEAEKVLEEVLRRWPDHPGANHYYVHALESSLTPERAIPSAQRLMGIMPWAGHIVHMPAHIWLPLGDWEAAAATDQRAAEVDREYFAATDMIGGSYTSYYIHNIYFIVYARSMQGRMTDALGAADTLAKATAPVSHEMPEMGEAISPTVLFAYVRFGKWDHVLEIPKPAPAKTVSTAIWHYARALALIARGDRSGAAVERNAFERAGKQVPSRAQWGQNRTQDVLEIAEEILSARLAGTAQESLLHWQRAASVQDNLMYDEPPDWYYPVRESWGAALLLAGRAPEGERVFREGLNKTPRDGRMLFGLMHSLKAQGKSEDAEWVRREFEASWARADIGLRLEDL